MVRNTAEKQTNTPSAPPRRKRICAKNRAAIKLLDEWMSQPDDMGEEFWQKFQEEFKEFRLHGEG